MILYDVLLFDNVKDESISEFHKMDQSYNWSKFFASQIPKTLETYTNTFKSMIESPYNHVFEIREDNAREIDNAIGYCGIKNVHSIHRKGEVFLAIGKKYSSCGYGSMIIDFLIFFVEHTLNLNKIHAQINKSNVSSVKLFEKFGFVIQGTLKNDEFIDGKWEDTLLMTKFLKTK